MKLSKEQIKNIAELARLEVDDEKVEYYADELSAVLDYVEQLNNVDTNNVSPKIQATSLKNIMREDRQYNNRKDAASRLADMMPSTKDGFARVKSVFKNKNK